MNKTKIEWCDYTENPVKGKCPMGCEYCYMWGKCGIGMRFKWNPEIRFDYELLAKDVGKFLKMKEPQRIFWGSTFELFCEHPLIDLPIIFQAVKVLDQHTHIFLTKQPQNLPKWFPSRDDGGHSNCWVGSTVTNDGMMDATEEAFDNLWSPVSFISFEPLLGQLSQKSLKQIRDYVCQWVIIGQQTPISKKTQPKIEWIQEIVEAADKAGIPVFLKDNLRPLIADSKLSATEAMIFYDNQTCDLRQEFPTPTGAADRQADNRGDCYSIQ